MEIGLCAWSFTGAHREAGLARNPHNPEDLAALAADSGLHSIECAPGPFEKMSSKELESFKEGLQQRGLQIIIDTGGANYAEDISPLRNALEVAAKIGAPVVRTTVSGMLEGDRRSYGREGWQAYLQALVDPFKQVMPLAEELGIPVGLENHQDLCSWEVLWLCEQIGSPMIGATMDCANALAVGETVMGFAERVMPVLKHVHLKDYTVHPTPSGYRLKRCPLGGGVVDWPPLIAAFERGAPGVLACIELGASTARHIRLLEEDYWSTYQPRPLEEAIGALRTLHQAARPPEEDWQTPHEREEDAGLCAAYELDQFDRSVSYLKAEELL